MFCHVKKLKLNAALIALLSSITLAEAAGPAPAPSHPNRTEGLAFGFGAGVKLLNFKNVATKEPGSATPNRSGDGFANTSTPILSLYARKYMPDLLLLPAFWGVEFSYLTDMRKTHIHANLNLAGGTLDTGYKYDERWQARAMLGAQLWSWCQLDLWAQAGLQLTNFSYQGITYEVAGVPQRFDSDNNFALTPAGGLEVRFCKPGLFASKHVVTDFILGWTAGYRKAINVLGTSTNRASFDIGMNANWTHEFGLKVMFRF